MFEVFVGGNHFESCEHNSVELEVNFCADSPFLSSTVYGIKHAWCSPKVKDIYIYVETCQYIITNRLAMYFNFARYSWACGSFTVLRPSEFSQKELGQSVITINDVHEDQAGTYTCEAQNGVLDVDDSIVVVKADILLTVGGECDTHK